MFKKIKAKLYNFLRWSEKYTKTDMVYLAKGGFWLTLGQFFVSISAFLLAIAYANLLPQEIFGTYKYILSIAGILGALSLTGMGTALIRSVAKGYEGTLQFAFWKNLKWSIFIIIFSILGSIYYFLNDNQTLAISILIAGAFLPILQSSNLYSAFLNGKKEFKAMTLYDIFRTLIPAISIFITIILTKNPITIVFVYFLSQSVTSFLIYKSTIKRYQQNTKKDNDSLNYSKHLSLMNILFTVANQIDKILVFHYLGAVQLAVYSFATAIPDQIKSLLKNIKTIAIPKLSEKNLKENKKIIIEKSIKLFLVIFIIIVLYIIFAPYIYNIFFNQYKESIFLSQIYAISLLTMFSLLPISSMYAQKQQKKLYIYNILSSILRILILFLMISLYGLIGAIIARIILSFVSMKIAIYLYFYQDN